MDDGGQRVRSCLSGCLFVGVALGLFCVSIHGAGCLLHLSLANNCEAYVLPLVGFVAAVLLDGFVAR